MGNRQGRTGPCHSPRLALAEHSGGAGPGAGGATPGSSQPDGLQGAAPGPPGRPAPTLAALAPVLAWSERARPLITGAGASRSLPRGGRGGGSEVRERRESRNGKKQRLEGMARSPWAGRLEQRVTTRGEGRRLRCTSSPSLCLIHRGAGQVRHEPYEGRFEFRPGVHLQQPLNKPVAAGGRNAGRRRPAADTHRAASSSALTELKTLRPPRLCGSLTTCLGRQGQAKCTCNDRGGRVPAAVGRSPPRHRQRPLPYPVQDLTTRTVRHKTQPHRYRYRVPVRYWVPRTG